LVAVLGIGIFFVDQYLWAWALAYWAIWGFWVIDRFMLMLHCTSHRILFKYEYKAFNKLIPLVLSPFFGQSPDTYFVHHMAMHHPENNLEKDLSSTMRFQRDSVVDWLRYFGRFFFGIMVELPMYFLAKGQRRMAARAFFGELSFLVAIALLAVFVNLPATFVVFIAPVIAIRILMMAGNWGQHAFVDASAPANPYKNSITCIDSRYNRRCFNDGYHIYHHVKARFHWSEYPTEFERNIATYGAEDAIVFKGTDFFLVWVCLMLGRYRTLARQFVQLPGAPVRSEEEIISFLKSRLKPSPPSVAAAGL
jgi:fatty acid desaturase